MSTTPTKLTKIVIVGGGFGGVRAAERLAGRPGVEVTLISARDGFTYYPQLYHTATGGRRAMVSLSLSSVLENEPVTFIQDSITTLDAEAKTITGSSGHAYSYDELVLALGSVTNYFGLHGLPELSYDIKTVEGAERFKDHLHRELTEDKKTEPYYVIVGGGPTGIELAAALAEYLRRITKHHAVKNPKYTIDLVEAAPHLLPRSPEKFGARVQRQLEHLGVRVMTGATVEGQTADALQLKGESITTKTVVWTAGIANNPFYKANAALFTLAKNGKVEVDEHLQARPNVYVIGDNAATQYSGMAQTALDNADYIATYLLQRHHGQTGEPYQPKAPISVIPVGTYWAAAQWGPVSMFGFSGYLLRRAADLIGYADIESWPKAGRVWLQNSCSEDNCAICQPA